jgi:hypothetical protein
MNSKLRWEKTIVSVCKEKEEAINKYDYTIAGRHGSKV